MPSRRDALATLGSAAIGSLAGCLDTTHAPQPYCQLKTVVVTWDHEGQRYSDDVGRSMGYPPVDGDQGGSRTRAAEELPSLAAGARDLTVDADLETRLEQAFTTVEYVLGFCGDAFDSCRNTRVATREGFNRIQVGDEARVTLADHTFHVHNVDAASDTDDWETAFSRFDFSTIHADHGEPLGDR